MKFTATQRIKNRIYMITLIIREPRQIVGFNITLDKNENRIQNIVDNAKKAKFYYSDANPSYQKVFYWGKHYYFNDKSYTFAVERINSDILKYIDVLHRHSKCFFRSLDTFKFVMNLFVQAYNKFGEFKLRFPRLKEVSGLIVFITYL